MAQTTTSESACNAVIALDTGAGTLVDISGSSNQVDLEFTINSGSSTTFDGDYEITKLCGKAATATLTILYSTTADEAWDVVKTWYHNYDGASRTLRIDMPDGDAGNDRWQGEYALLSYSTSLSSSEAGPVVITANLKGDGEIQQLVIGT